MIRKTVFYRGRVQGVGFRFTASRVAMQHEVSGYVRNLRDGRVEMVAEGDPAEVNNLLGDIADRMRDYIDEAEVTTEKIQQPAHADFEVRR
ncbi:MAG: acylphosphatase [Phycisphaeraceae bacterium]